MKNYVIGADLIRIISGFGVVLIHVTDPFLAWPPFYGVGGIEWLLVNIINAAFRIAVPLFIMLSGFLLLDLLKDFDFKTFYKKRFLRIGFPLIFWLVIFFIWQYFLGYPTTAVSIINRILSVNLEHLYFLFIILELYFVTPLFFVFMKNTAPVSRRNMTLIAIFFTLSLSAINVFFPKARVLTNKNILTIFIPYISYYLSGRVFANIPWIVRNSFYLFLIYSGLVLFTAFASNGVVNSYLRSYGSPNIMIMTFIIFITVLNVNPKTWLLKHPLIIYAVKAVASTIFGIYLIHTIIIDIFDRILEITPPKLMSLDISLVGIKVLGVFAVSFIIVFAGKKIPYLKALFG